MSTSPAPLRVLFLCTGNSARRQVAEALLRHKGGQRYEVASAGVEPARQVHPLAVSALAAYGIDWSDRRSKGLEAVSERAWDVIITTCDRSREACPTFGNRPIYAHWTIPDPVSAPEDRREAAFADTVQNLARRIDLMVAVRLDLSDREALKKAVQLTETGSHEVRELSSSGS